MGAGIALAIVNAVIAMVLLCASDSFYATGRDCIWPGPNEQRAGERCIRQFSSPWVGDA